MDTFGTPLAQAAITKTNPAEWWIHYGSCAPQLQRIAVRVLSQTTSSSNCERNWSTFSLIHTKKRNRLKHKKLQKLVYVHYNMRLKLRHMQRKSAKELEMGFNPINLDNIFEEDDPLNAWIEEREDAMLDDEQNFTWLPEELLNESDNEETQGEDMANISPTSSNEKSVHLSTSSGDNDGDDSGGNDGGAYQNEPEQRHSSPYHGELGMCGFPDDVDPSLFGINASSSTQNKRDRHGRTHGRLNENIHDSFTGSYSRSLTTSFNENEISESSSQTSHSYQPEALYPPYFGQNSSYGSFAYHLPYPMFPTNDMPYGSIPPHFAYNVMPPSFSSDNTTMNSTFVSSHGWEGDQNQGSDESRDVLDPPRHSFWW